MLPAETDPTFSLGSIRAWRERGLDLWRAMPELHRVISVEGLKHLLEAILTEQNPACVDGGNAAHVMAQNDNVVVLGRWLEVDASSFAVALSAGMIHDLNKYQGAKLRTDRFSVRRPGGEKITSIQEAAEIIALNHYGERTRAVLSHLSTLGLLNPSIAIKVDRVVVHHGLGSSGFVRDLVKGKIAQGRDIFVDGFGRALLVVPEQPKLTLSSVLHDVADSVQQMQAGSAWIAKYPLGYWQTLGLTWFDHLSNNIEAEGVPASLPSQLQVEQKNCSRILEQAMAEQVLKEAAALRFERALEALVSASREWIQSRPEVLALPRGRTVFHQVGQAFGIAPSAAKDLLQTQRPGVNPRVDRAVLRACLALDDERARMLEAAIRR